MADTQPDQNHPYHMVAPSPWPVLGAAAVMVLAGGAIVFFHDGGPWIMLAGLCALRHFDLQGLCVGGLVDCPADASRRHLFYGAVT